ncbi:MAG: 16S rRNA (cytosine(1402)-N(4))-methyltransferase RsmH [Bacteroidales bacterium]|nr:16S rRNA (cytosine(1402)-N(4))-methyltransferase RsmH [Bacteroidales bacterium]
MISNGYHTPVLLEESIEGLSVRPDGTYVDLTYGGGGHSREILKQLTSGTLIAFDQDPAVKPHLISDRRFVFVQHNYRYLKNYLDYMGISAVDGILADLGVSSRHLDDPGRGFSFRFDAPLDMRMNPAQAESAADLANSLDDAALKRIFANYGELNQPGRLATRLADARRERPVKTTGDLAGIFEPMLPANRKNKMLAQIFQAFRIAVNHEMESLEVMLSQTPQLIRQGGRLVVISYHSLEDRLVKNFIRAGNADGKLETDFFGNPIAPFKAINRKVTIPDTDEATANPRARSAKLRIAERN